MTDFNYKTYCISQLREWVSDCLCSAEPTAKDIYEAILSEVSDYTNCLKKQYETGLELQNLLTGHRSIEFNDVWESKVEEDLITGEQWITFPPELMNKLGWKEGDELEWIDNHNGTYTIRKV